VREAELSEDAEKRIVGQQARQHGRDFGVGVRSDGIEFAHHALLLWVAVEMLTALNVGREMEQHATAGPAIDRRL
jgi:hypothetical protein